jgi:hypothetical protein
LFSKLKDDFDKLKKDVRETEMSKAEVSMDDIKTL